jgi:hypothetical protein
MIFLDSRAPLGLDLILYVKEVKKIILSRFSGGVNG